MKRIIDTCCLSQRGTVAVEWIILSLIIMVAVVSAFGPAFQQALTAGVQNVSNALSAQAAGAGS